MSNELEAGSLIDFNQLDRKEMAKRVFSVNK